MSNARRFARAAGLISGATMLSRLLGLVREQLFAALLGATAFADAFIVAFRIPNLLRDLFAEGALSQAFVPTFKQTLKADGPERAYELANRVAGTLVIIIGAIVAIGALAAPTIVDAMAGDFADVPGKFDLTVKLTRIMLPFLMIVSMSAVAMGMLNAQDRFAAPARAPAMFNVMSIAVGLGLWMFGATGTTVAIGWSCGTVLGGLAQLGIQLPGLWRVGYRPRARADLRMRDPAVRRIARLMGPAVVGLAAVQVNVFVNTLFATTEKGGASWLNYAFRFMQLPIGVFGVAIATVATTRFADAAADRDRPAMGSQLGEGLRLVAFLTIPATVGLFLMGRPIIELIYERGKFTPLDSWSTTRALELYIVGLVAYAGVKVIAPAFYAVDRPRVPMIASITAVGVNVVMNIVLHPIYGFRILALGTAAAATFNFAVLYFFFQKVVAPTRHLALLGYVLRIATCAAIMGAAVWGCHHVLVDAVTGVGLGPRAIRVFVPIGLGVVIYAGACAVMRVEELGHFTRRLRR